VQVDLEFEPQGGLPGHLAKAYKVICLIVKVLGFPVID